MRITINYNGWNMEIKDTSVTVSKSGDTYVYDVPPYEAVKHENEYVFFYMSDEMYQFKFEENNFLVGDVFDKDKEHVKVFANRIFAEAKLVGTTKIRISHTFLGFVEEHVPNWKDLTQDEIKKTLDLTTRYVGESSETYQWKVEE